MFLFFFLQIKNEPGAIAGQECKTSIKKSFLEIWL